MKITDIKIRRLYPEGRMRAILSVTFDHELVVHDVKIIELEHRIFAAMPSRRDENGKYRDIVHPIHASMRQSMEMELLEAYNHAVKKQQSDFPGTGVADSKET